MGFPYFPLPLGADPETGVKLRELGTPLASEDRMGSSFKGCERELSVVSSSARGRYLPSLFVRFTSHTAVLLSGGS